MGSYTKKLYTRKPNSVIVFPSGGRPSITCKVVWEGDSLKVIKKFPDDVKSNLGQALLLVQNGLEPKNSSPVPGLDDVYELRDQDERAWYRVLYLRRIKDELHVLHCFEKKTNRIEKKDINTARTRLATVKRRLQEELRHAKKAARNDRQHLSGSRI